MVPRVRGLCSSHQYTTHTGLHNVEQEVFAAVFELLWKFGSR